MNQYTSIDHVITMGFCIIMAYSFIPNLWIGAVLAGLSGLLNAIAPELFWWIPVLLYPSLAFMLALWWPSRIKPTAG
jgi:hypothetical protein